MISGLPQPTFNNQKWVGFSENPNHYLWYLPSYKADRNCMS